MKYRTTIEVVCDASDKDDACYIAGEYLRGTVDLGVSMKCKTRSLATHRAVKCGMISLVMLFCFSALLFSVTTSKKDGTGGAVSFRTSDTCTVQPELKTKNTSEFQEAWEMKKDEAILAYCKN